MYTGNLKVIVRHREIVNILTGHDRIETILQESTRVRDDREKNFNQRNRKIHSIQTLQNGRLRSFQCNNTTLQPHVERSFSKAIRSRERG